VCKYYGWIMCIWRLNKIHHTGNQYRTREWTFQMFVRLHSIKGSIIIKCYSTFDLIIYITINLKINIRIKLKEILWEWKCLIIVQTNNISHVLVNGKCHHLGPWHKVSTRSLFTYRNFNQKVFYSLKETCSIIHISDYLDNNFYSIYLSRHFLRRNSFISRQLLHDSVNIYYWHVMYGILKS